MNLRLNQKPAKIQPLMNQNRIVLLAKKPGLTSFSSLFTVKHAFKTSKVGHTGTLDSFAAGLLVVCVGSLTRLAGRITEFSKTYKAVIKFGEETDTLECTGNVVRRAELPTEKSLEAAVKKYTGKILQQPPSFSAIHIDGKRASDLARSGKTAEIPFRHVQVFSAEIQEIMFDSSAQDSEKRVLACCIEFSVSKGTYIRSLARDIANECGSAGHLVGLLRTKVGNFRLEDAAGFAELEEFNIENAFISAEKTRELEKIAEENKKNNIRIKKEPDEAELELENQCVKKSVPMTKELATQCGFGCLTLAEGKNVLFENGVKLQSNMFTTSPFEVKEKIAAVFTLSEDFKGLLEKNEQGYFSYSFVVH